MRSNNAATGEAPESAAARVLQTVDKMRPEIISLVAELVQIPSVNPRHPGVDYSETVGGESSCNARLADAYRAVGCEIAKVEKEPGRANLVGILKGRGGGKSLIYNGHIDVVPVGNPSDWNFGDPFSGRVENGRLYGRGSCDMKGGVVCQQKGVEAVLRSGFRLNGDLLLESVVGEETMSHEVGVSAVCEKYKADAAVVSEPTAPPIPLAVVPVTPGLLWFTITCEGKASHSSVRREIVRAGGKGAEIAVNAIEKAVVVLNALRQLEEQWGQSKTHPLFQAGHFTIHPGVIRGGPHGVMIPFVISQFCTIEYAVWYPPQERESGIKAEIEDYVQAACQLDPWLKEHPPRIEWNLHWPPSDIPADHPIVQACVRAHDQASTEVCSGGLQAFAAVCDAAFLNQAGIPAVIYGPGSLLQAHAVDEYVEVEELITATKAFALLAMDWCGYEAV